MKVQSSAQLVLSSYVCFPLSLLHDRLFTLLQNFSGNKTGRSPKDKRIVYEETSKNDVWWGPVNIKMDEHTFEINRERAIDYLNTRDTVYVFDGFAGVSPSIPIYVLPRSQRCPRCSGILNIG
jgi:hypothetical protein